MATISTPTATANVTSSRIPQYSRKVMPGSSQPKLDRSVEVYEKLLRGLREGFNRFRSRESQHTLSAEAQESPETGPKLGDHFFRLPLEIQLQVVNQTSLYDILRLRQTSSQFRQLILNNESYLVTRYVKAVMPPFMTHIFPPPAGHKLQITYLTELAYKQRISTDLATAIAKNVMRDIGGRGGREPDPEDKRRLLGRLRRSMSPLVFVLYHFFETYLKKKLEHQAQGKVTNTATNLQLQIETMVGYPDCMLLQIHQMYHLVLHIFFRRMSMEGIYIGRLRLLGTVRPEQKDLCSAFVLGGIEKIWELFQIKGSKKRRKTMLKWLKSIREFNIPENTTRSIEQGGNTAISVIPKTATTLKAVPTIRAAVNKEFKKGNKEKAADVTGITPALNSLLINNMDDLIDLWIPAAEARLIGRGIISNLNEVGCCGVFIGQLLASVPDCSEGDDNDEYVDDSEYDDDDDEDDDEPQDNSPTNESATSDPANQTDDANQYEESGGSDVTSSTA